MPKFKIMFVLPSLVAGGAERVLSFVAQHIDKNVFDVTLVIIGFEKDRAYSTEGVNTVYFNKSRMLSGIPQLFSYIRKNKPHLIVSCMNHVNIPVALILLIFPKIKLVTREANMKKITAIYHGENKFWLYKKLLNISYRKTSKIICQSKDMADEMVTEYFISPSKLCVINNPISDGFKVKKQMKPREIPHYITVGRLHAEKGHERILHALSQLKFPFHYTIIGTGEALESIQQTVKRLNMESKVKFIPYTDKVPEYLRESDLFLQGSFAEGFPNALLESCAVGTPALAYKAPGGTNEILENGINGFMATDDTDFVNYLNIIQSDTIFETSVVSNSTHKKFDKKHIIKKYENVFLNVLR
ncbi:MAG: glycosyltransferase [Gelidibacter sp.]